MSQDPTSQLQLNQASQISHSPWFMSGVTDWALSMWRPNHSMENQEVKAIEQERSTFHRNFELV